MYKKINIMSYNIFVDNLSTIIIDPNKKQVVNTINPHSYITAKDDKIFEAALRASNTLLPDGSGIVLAAKKLKGVSIKKVAGSDLHEHLLKLLNKNKGSIFYMGSSRETLDKIHNRLSTEYPDIRAGYFSPSYKAEFTRSENIVKINKINDFNPDVLFIGMTAPKQEKWLHQHKDELNFKIASSIGAVFDFYAGTVVRPSQFWINLHLEWLLRFVKEPKRLWWRNFVSTPLFLLDIILYKVKILK